MAGLRLLKAIGPADLPRLSEVSLDLRGACFHAASLGSFGIVFRIHSGAQVRARQGLDNDWERKQNGQRGPRASAIEKCAGSGAGGHGAGAADQRAADDPHVYFSSQR